MANFGLKVVSIGFLLCNVGCTSVPVQNYDHTTNGTSAVMTYQAHFWDGDCTTKPFNIKFIEKPSNGTITIKDAPKKIAEGADIGDNQDCAGKPVTGKEVYYTAHKGFNGTDEFLIEITSTGISEARRSKIVVNVK